MAWSYIQSAETTTFNGPVDLTLAMTGVTPGALLVAMAGAFSSGVTFSFADNHGDTWINIQTASFAPSTVLAYAAGVTGGDTSITVTKTADTQFYYLAIAEYTGQAVSPLDQSRKANGYGTTPNSGALTTTEDNEIIVGAIVTETNTQTLTPDSDLTVLQDRGGVKYWFLHNPTLGVATGSYDISGTLSSGAAWQVIAASFKMATGGGSGSDGAAMYYYNMMQG